MPANGATSLEALEYAFAGMCSKRAGPQRHRAKPFSAVNRPKADARTRTGDPFIRVKRVYLADFAICLQMPESRQTTKSVEVRRSPQRSSDVFQRCSNRSASRSAIGSTSRSAAGAGFCPYTPSGVVYPERALRHTPHRLRRAFVAFLARPRTAQQARLPTNCSSHCQESDGGAIFSWNECAYCRTREMRHGRRT
jgi:hypothetical protein